jgi:CRP-like cAMP-binding protein
MPITSFIRTLETAVKFSHEEEQALRKLPIRETEIKAGQDIVREGDQPTRVCFVIAGMACTSRMITTGRRQIFNFHMTGDAPDLLSLHLDVLDHTISTIATSRVGFIHHDAIKEVCSKHPRITAALWRHTLIDSAIFRTWMANIGQKNARARISHLLCEMFLRSEAIGLAKDSAIAFPIKQVDIADALGLSVVHVNRVVQELRSEGLIAWGNGTLDILKWQSLQEEGDFAPEYLHITRKAA